MEAAVQSLPDEMRVEIEFERATRQFVEKEDEKLARKLQDEYDKESHRLQTVRREQERRDFLIAQELDRLHREGISSSP